MHMYIALDSFFVFLFQWFLPNILNMHIFKIYVLIYIFIYIYIMFGRGKCPNMYMAVKKDIFM